MLTFYDKMRIACLSIPAGRVATYGQIAMLCGAPTHSRQVGYGLKNNLAGEDIPAYRVVNSKGELSGACHFEFPELQKMLLTEDDIKVVWNGKNWCVDLKKYGWTTSLDEVEKIREEIRRREKNENTDI